MSDNQTVTTTKYLEVYAPNCSRTRQRDGYARKSYVIAEKALGKPLPAFAVVHHVNEVKHEDTNTNLVICENENYHRLLHLRMRILAVGGNPDTQKICSTCHSLKDRNYFYVNNSNAVDGLQNNCILCAKKHSKAQKDKNAN